MDELKNFLKELEDNPEVRSVILFGSHARGNARVDSDVDLIVICNETKRGVEKRNGQFFELVYVTEEDAKTFYLENRDNAVRTWEIARILFDRDGTAEKIKQFVCDIEREGKRVFTKEELEHFRFDIENTLQGIKADVGVSDANSNYLMNSKLLSLLELFFDVRGLWKPAPKQLLYEIQRQNPVLYEQVVDFYAEQSTANKVLVLESIANRVLSQ